MSGDTSRNFGGYVAAALAAVSTAVIVLSFQGWAFAAVTTAGFEAETMSLASRSGGAFADRATSGGAGLLVRTNATASKSVTTTRADGLVVRARGDQCGGAPRMVVRVGAPRSSRGPSRPRGGRIIP